MKKILMYSFVLVSVLTISPKSANAVLQCNSNLTPALQLASPECWTSVYVPDSTDVACVWSETGREKICVQCGNFGCDWSGSYTTTGNCGGGYTHYDDNVFLSDNCGHSTTWCTNVGMPSNPYTHLVDTSYYDNNCYYTTPATWSAPDATGMRTALTVNQLTAAGTTTCSNASNISYVDAEPTLKVNGLDSDTVNKFNPITLSWSSNYATSCNVPGTSSTVGGWTGVKAINNLVGEPKDISSAPMPANSSAPNTVLNYQISCTNPGLVNVLDTVPVTVICTPDLTPAWGTCNKQCGTGIKERTVRYANCFEDTEQQSCNTEICPVSSEWKEVRP